MIEDISLTGDQIALRFKSETPKKIKLVDDIDFLTGDVFYIKPPEDGKGSDKDKVRYVLRNKLFEKNPIKDQQKIKEDGKNVYKVVLQSPTTIRTHDFDKGFYKDIVAIEAEEITTIVPKRGAWDFELRDEFYSYLRRKGEL